MKLLLQRHCRIALFNLLLVALAGLVLRYKIVYALPFINQKFLLHGHSHFAFTGWIAQLIMVLMVQLLYQYNEQLSLQPVRWLLSTNLITAYGMLIAFPLQGYGAFAILFSTLNILVSWCFAVYFWIQLNRTRQAIPAETWLKAAVLFNVLSSIGVFALAYVMANKISVQEMYMGAVYFFLHFQYNGFFFFSCMGLAFATVLRSMPRALEQKVFWLFAGSCIPAYLLSVLWWQLPAWSFALAVVAAITQLLGWGLTVRHIRKLSPVNSNVVSWLLGLAALALSIKLLLQLGVTVPALTKLAFGIRPVVVAYLHLVLLGFISFYLLAHAVNVGLITLNRNVKKGLCIFIASVAINELLLVIQGLAGIFGLAIGAVQPLLLLAALGLVVGMGTINLGIRVHSGEESTVPLLHDN